MNVVVSVDSFKGSITSLEAGNAVCEGIHACVDASVTVYPLSDGGEGFVESYRSHQSYEEHFVEVFDAMGFVVSASYSMIEESHTAVMEVASICGIDRICKQQGDILYATTFGLGQMILDACDRGCKNFIIGLGGSGTNDGGCGMLMALGYKFLDKAGMDIALGAIGLSKLDHIQADCVDERLNDAHFTIACDVTNPLTGPNGCSAVFGPQKGADKALVRNMDAWMKKYADIVKKYHPSDDKKGGSGAAGGLGFAFQAFLHASLTPGIKIILDAQTIEQAIAHCDLVVTGEGCIDAQTMMGKAPSGIAQLAKKYNKPVIAFAGKVAKEATVCNEQGIDAYFSIQVEPCSLVDALDKTRAYENLKNTTEQVFRLINISSKSL